MKNSKVRKDNVPPFVIPKVIDMNLIVSPIDVHPIATLPFEPIKIGIPIMREGFITETGLLVGSLESSTRNI